MFLTREELLELTERTYARYQIAWLVKHDWKFEVGADGNPKVLRSYAEQRMGSPSATRRRRPRLGDLSA